MCFVLEFLKAVLFAVEVDIFEYMCILIPLEPSACPLEGLGEAGLKGLGLRLGLLVLFAGNLRIRSDHH